MNILQVGSTDVTASRFNGHDLHKTFRQWGNRSCHAVWHKESPDPETWQLFDVPGRTLLRDFIARMEGALSLQSVFFPFSLHLFANQTFRRADLVHYHLIHTGYFSLATLPLLSRLRPSVWTLHDPWAMTGHCVYPYDCERWRNGCGSCPYLETNIPMRRDHTAFMWKLKDFLYHASRFDVIVASRWMLSMARSSPLMSRFRLHHIPFGVDLNEFRPMDSMEARRWLGVIPGSQVICFRATKHEFKGLPYIKECLRGLRTPGRACILTVGRTGLLTEFRDRYQIVELGWVNDSRLMAAAYSAADIFLMPSTAEAFGMMAMEAMACGTPTVVFEGTSLPEVVHAPEGGMAVPMRDADALRAAVKRLLEDDGLRERMGRRARELAGQFYDFQDHAKKVYELYEDVIARRKGDGQRDSSVALE